MYNAQSSSEQWLLNGISKTATSSSIKINKHEILTQLLTLGGDTQSGEEPKLLHGYGANNQLQSLHIYYYHNY
jgi:hypothetical protein